jgi:hypothetical protein
MEDPHTCPVTEGPERFGEREDVFVGERRRLNI